MDAFRRLRSRRKSKGQADAFTSFADAESNYNRSSSSAWQTSTARSSATVSRPSDAEKKLSHDQLRQPVSPISQRTPTSSSKIQPMLVGISRPFATDSRPNTAASLQNALDRAAESINNQHGSQSPTSQLGLRTGRYIDIFAISGRPTKSPSTFNEDVAERNLDTIALIEEQHYKYEPSSKYQEEVAARNAHQITAQRTSSMRRPAEENRVKSPDSLSGYPPAYSHQARFHSEQPRNRQVQEVSAYHSRQNSSRTKDGPVLLPAIPQEQSTDDFGPQNANGAKVKEAELEMERAKARWLEARRQTQTEQAPDIDKPLPASPPFKEYALDLSPPFRTSATKRASELSDTQPVRQSESVPPNNHQSDYLEPYPSRTSKQEPYPASPYKPDRRSANTAVTNSSEDSRVRSDVSTGYNDRRSRASDMSRSARQRRPSVTSNNSYKRVVVGNRTIMDLTAEDDAEVNSVASYLQTPIIEDARADAFQKVMPTVIDHQSPPQRILEKDPAVPNSRWSSALEPVLDLDQLARQSQVISDTARLAAAARSQAKLAENSRSVTPPPSALTFSTIRTMTGSSPPKTIAFSKITTLTAITPRSSSEELNPVATSKAAEQNFQHDSSTYTVPVNGLMVHGLAGEKDKSSQRISANIAPLVKIFADVQPDETKSQTSISKSRPVQAESSNGKKSQDPREIAKRNEKRRAKLERAEAIREAAKKKIPAGPLDQEPLPGVKARDFALSPVEKPTNKRIEALSERKRSPPESKKASSDKSSSSKSSSSEKKDRAKSAKANTKVTFDEKPSSSLMPKSEKRSTKKSGKSNSSAVRKSRPISSFDEEAFKKKHAEANAALLRLQQSLQQNLDDDSSRVQTPTNSGTPVARTFTPTSSVAYGKSPVAQSSPSAAAIAMIAAATSSPVNQTRPSLNARISSGGSRSRVEPAEESDFNAESQPSTIRTTELIRPQPDTLNPPGQFDANSKPPPSPGEVSLSAFPIPTPRAMSPESTKSPPAYVKDVGGPVRRGSQASRVSTASAFSIPFTMVPSRMGSLPENRISIPGPPNPAQMQSIASIIPPVHPVESL